MNYTVLSGRIVGVAGISHGWVTLWWRESLAASIRVLRPQLLLGEILDTSVQVAVRELNPGHESTVVST